MTLLKVHELCKAFGGVKALDEASCVIAQGKITALIGPNGSGKSTMFNVISRLLTEDHGKIELKGEGITTTKDFTVARQGIARTFQQVRLFQNLTIEEHLEIALREDDEYMWRNAFGATKSNRKKIQEILRLVGLQKQLSTYATDLSYGQRKLLDLAMAITKPHSLLMLDEPVAGINPQLRDQIKEILRTLHKQGETILVIEHDMNFIMDLADYVYVLDRGKVIAQGIPAEIQQNEQVLQAYLGE